MSTTTVSRLPLRFPTKSNNSTNGTSTGQQQKNPMPTKLQKGLVKKTSKPSLAGINKSPNVSTTQITTSAAATDVDQIKRPPPKTNVDTTNKTSSVSRLLPPKTTTTTSSSITNDLKGPAKKNLAAQTAKQTIRKNDDTRTQIGATPSSNIRKPLTQTPKSTSANTPRKKTAPIKQQSRTSTKNSTLATSTQTRTGTAKLLAEIEKLRTENVKLHTENKELMQEKGDHIHYRSELDIANNLIMEQAIMMSDQQSLIEELMAQLDEQERVCQDLQNVIDTFKTNHDILDDVKSAWHSLDLTICSF